MSEVGESKNPIKKTAGKISEFVTDRVDDAKYQVESRQRKFAISAKGSKVDRAVTNVEGWYDKEIRSRMEETQENFEKLVGKKDDDGNEKEMQREAVGEAVDDLACGLPITCCGIFSV